MSKRTRVKVRKACRKAKYILKDMAKSAAYATKH